MKKYFFTFFIAAGLFYCESLSAQKIFIRALGKANDNGTLFRGGSVVQGHENEIEAISYSETDSSCGFIPGGGDCKTATGPWIFSMNVNPSIIDFKSYTYPGKKIGRITINFETAGSTPFNYYTVVMTNVFIKMISESSGGNAPQFYIQLDPTTIEWTYTEQKTDGTTGKKTSFGWNRTKQAPL
jgi:type VI protein secretion system component Hcp